MNTYKFISDFWFIAFSGLSLILLFLFGETNPADLRSRQRTIYLTVTSAIFLIGVANEFLYHRDRPLLLVVQLGALLLMTISSVVYFRNGDAKPKLWRYTGLASAALVLVLSWIHIAQS